jgi:hypothetical protein
MGKCGDEVDRESPATIAIRIAAAVPADHRDATEGRITETRIRGSETEIDLDRETSATADRWAVSGSRESNRK